MNTSTQTMNTNHTPSPWRIVNRTEPDFVAKNTSRKGQAICSVEMPFDTISIHAEPDEKPCPSVDEWSKQGEANAALIAAAPEILAALIECVQVYESHRDGQATGHLWPDPNHIFHAREAIKKAMP